MNATKRKDAILKEFPNVNLKEHGDKVKFTIDSLDHVGVTKISKLDEFYMIDIKRSGKGLVVIVD